MSFFNILSFAALASLVASSSVTPQLRAPQRPPPVEGATNVTQGQGIFEQPIDHNDPSLGTFSQRYWYDTTYYSGPGSPVVLFTPGEIAADGYTGYLTNRTLTGLFAESVGGATLLLEHRYWGQSSPYENLTAETLQYLTLRNAIADLVNFAETVDLPFDTNHSNNAASAPWILSGGSYSGALTGWVEAISPGTFWAYQATSAVVEAVWDFWQYFDPVQQGMATNCSADVTLVIDHIDSVLMNGTAEQKLELKTMFGLGGVVHDDDFASVLQNGPWAWQSNQFDTGYSSFFQWCDYVEGIYSNATNGTVPGPEGVGLTTALAGYADWIRTQVVPGACASYGYGWTGEYNVECYDTYNASSPIYTDTSVSNAGNRQWNWVLCNEPFGFWQDGAPTSRPTIVSRLITPEYFSRQCGLYFPTVDGMTYGYAEGRTVEDVNAWTGGWDNTNTTRLMWVNGQYDPWRDATVSADDRPGGPLASTPNVPVLIVEGGFHCSDLLVRNNVNAGVAALIDQEVSIMRGWVNDYYTSNSTTKVKRKYERTRQNAKLGY